MDIYSNDSKNIGGKTNEGKVIKSTVIDFRGRHDTKKDTRKNAGERNTSINKVLIGHCFESANTVNSRTLIENGIGYIP